jgi:hypothetical protein
MLSTQPARWQIVAYTTGGGCFEFYRSATSALRRKTETMK